MRYAREYRHGEDIRGMKAQDVTVHINLLQNICIMLLCMQRQYIHDSAPALFLLGLNSKLTSIGVRDVATSHMAKEALYSSYNRKRETNIKRRAPTTPQKSWRLLAPYNLTINRKSLRISFPGVHLQREQEFTYKWRVMVYRRWHCESNLLL